MLSKKEKWVIVISAIVAAVAGGTLLALFYLDHTEARPFTGGEYREGIVGQPAYINPVLAKTNPDKSLTELLFASLKDLSDSIEVRDGGRTVRVHLKENLQWSDGAEITADDAIFTVQSIEDPDAASPLLPAFRGVTTERVSKLEVNFKLPTPYVFFTDNFEDLRLIPKHIFSDIPSTNWRLSEYNLRPIGSGPYVAANAVKGPDGFFTLMQLTANPRAAEKTPYITNFVVRFFRNRDELLKEFNAGRLDGFFAAAADDLSLIKRPYQEVDFPSPVYYAVFWNQSAATPLADKDVRKALRLAADRDEIIRKALNGKATSSTDPLSPAFLPDLAASSSASSSPIETAKAILAKDGWVMGSDGVLVKKDKKTETRLEFTLTVPDTAFLVSTANTLSEEWKAIGVNAKVNVAPLENVTNDAIKNRTYEGLLFGNTLERSGDLYAFWHSSERFSPGLNLALYKNSKADSLIENIRKEPDPAKRLSEMQDLRTTIALDEPALFLYSPDYGYATSKRAMGISSFEINDAADRFRNVSDWYLATKRVFKK
jgi:peptide/nickel transport system substrate-binding protein